jgi:hypothetical protein
LRSTPGVTIDRRVGWNDPFATRILAASLAEVGRIDEARLVATELLRLQSNAYLRRTRGSSYRRPEDLELYVAALRKAGLPEEPAGKLTESSSQQQGTPSRLL